MISRGKTRWTARQTGIHSDLAVREQTRDDFPGMCFLPGPFCHIQTPSHAPQRTSLFTNGCDIENVYKLPRCARDRSLYTISPFVHHVPVHIPCTGLKEAVTERDIRREVPGHPVEPDCIPDTSCCNSGEPVTRTGAAAPPEADLRLSLESVLEITRQRVEIGRAIRKKGIRFIFRYTAPRGQASSSPAASRARAARARRCP